MAITHGTLTLAADITAHAKPAAALAGAGAGLCTNGAHLVKVGFVTSTGVSTLSAASDAVTVVATQLMRHRAVEAAVQLADRGIEVEVIDPRTLVPFDDATVTASLARTSRLLVVQEGPPDGGWGASLVARVCTQNFDLLDAPPVLLASDATPVPYAAAMEDAWLPTSERIVTEVTRLVEF